LPLSFHLRFHLARQLQVRYYFLMIIAISLGIAFIVPLVFLFFVRRFDLFGTGKYHFNLITLAGGAFAYWLAANINTWVLTEGWATREQVIRIIAPIVEELLKSLILVYLVRRADFNFIVDGAIYGFGAGIGFAIFENYEYVMGHSEIALTVAVARVFSTNLVHATASGMIGTVLAYQRSRISWDKWIVVFFGYVFSTVIHMGFNTMVNEGALLVFAFLFGGAGLAIIWFTIRRGLNIQKEWVAEKLGMADRTTKEEMKVVSNIDTINEILSPVEKRFGSQKASLVRNLVYKQAEIGIKRKLLETTPSESKRKEMTEIIATLVQDTNDLRNQIGTYCMILVREVYLGQDTQVWNLLNARIAAAGLGQKGGGLWDRVNVRMKESNETQEEQP
jgi:RsiW-degrading membrane proteinase PrsW (M82 family)